MTFLEFFGAKKEIQIPPSMIDTNKLNKDLSGKNKTYEGESGRFISEDEVVPHDFETNSAYTFEQRERYREIMRKRWG